MKKVRYILALLAAFTLVITLSNVSKAENPKVTPVEGLPTVGTVEKLRSILADAESSRPMMTFGRGLDTADGAVMRDGLAKSSPLLAIL